MDLKKFTEDMKFKFFLFIIIYTAHIDGIKLLSRYSSRGLIPCKLCGYLNGMRAKRCKNKLCSSFTNNKPPKNAKITNLVKLDTVEIVQTTLDTKLFSVQIRDRDMEHRNFVQIIDKPLSIHNAYNAICYVDTCKYASSNNINTQNNCQHIKNSIENIQQAVPLDINVTLWYQMNLSEETKTRLWKMYSETQLLMPIIQRINKTIFVIKCDVSEKFPVGLLHVTLDDGGGSLSNDNVYPR